MSTVARTGIAAAFTAVRRAGVVALYGVPPRESVVPYTCNELFSREISVATSVAGCTDRTIKEALDVLARDPIFFGGMVGRVVELVDLPDELTHWHPRPSTRTVVRLGPANRD